MLQSQRGPPVIRDDRRDDDDDDLQPAHGGKKRKQPTTAATATAPQSEESLHNDKNDTTVNNIDCELKVTHTEKAPAEDVISKKPKKGDGEGENVTLSNTDNTAANSLDEEELYDDDVDLRCISSNTELNDNLDIDDEANNEQGDASCCGSENDDLLIECIEIDEDSESDSCSYQQEAASGEHAVRQPQVNQTNNPDNDVCYICGTNLSGKGFKSRVAHMKRCSTKFGPAMKTSSAEVEDDLMVPVESSSSSSKEVVCNPYKNAQWHGDSGDIVQQSKEKQSMLNQFFKAPVRSLTNVLMAGSRQAKKRADDIKSGTNNNKTGKKAPFRKGSWASSNRRSGQCPSYKRIPGTDFLCDGFYYAGTLTQNYFLTHFHSDHYGGITKKWNEGIIYCSVSSYILGSFLNCSRNLWSHIYTNRHASLSFSCRRLI